MKRIIVCILVTAMLFLSGCSYTQTGIDALLKPPKLSKQQDEIFSAVSSIMKKDSKLKYPRKGDYKSAFVIKNIDNEPTEEAIVFFEDITAKERPLKISVVDQEDGRWVRKYTINEDASDVEKVSFLTSDGKIYIVIGFTALSKTEKFVNVYSYQDSKIKMVGESLRCSSYEVFDITGDGESEVVSMTSQKSDREAQTVTATVHKISVGGLVTVSSTQMDPNTTDFDNIYQGKIDATTPALYVDGRKGTATVTTEILVMDKGKLVNLIYNPNSKKSSIKKTERTVGSYCEDLNDDGVYEIPKVEPAPGYENAEKHQILSFIEWYNYSKGELMPYKTSYVDYKLGYLYSIPEQWIDKVTLSYSSNDNEVFFYEYNAEEKDRNIQLASIRVMEKTQYLDYIEDNKDTNYRILEENGQLIYLYQLYPNSSSLALYQVDFEKGFALLK